MKNYRRGIAGFMLLLAVVLIPHCLSAQNRAPADQTDGVEQEPAANVPDLATIIPSAAELSGRLKALDAEFIDKLDFVALEQQYDAVRTELEGYAKELQRIYDLKDYKYNKLVELREAVRQVNKHLLQINNPISQEIRKLDDKREEWLAEKKRWGEWRSHLTREKALDQFKLTFAKADKSIDTALRIILQQLEAMLAVQKKSASVQIQIQSLAVELDGFIRQERKKILFNSSPSMFSPQYFEQFGAGLLSAFRAGLNQASWPGRQFFDAQGWIVFVQIFVSLAMFFVVYRNRQKLYPLHFCNFLAQRPVASGLFIGTMATVYLYEYEGSPDTWELMLYVVGGISCARLLGGLNKVKWQTHFINGLVSVLIFNKLIDVFNCPLPLFRLYTVFASLLACFLCLRWAAECVHHKGSKLYIWLLRLAALFFVFITLSELWGKKGLSSHLFASLIDSTVNVIAVMLFIKIISGGLEWLLRYSPLFRMTVLGREVDSVLRWVTPLITFAMCFYLLPAILMIWGVYDTLDSAIKGLWGLGFSLGSQQISAGMIFTAAGFVYGSFVLSWVLRKLITDEIPIMRRVEKGVRLSIGRLIHYVLICAGFFLALGTLGFKFTNITIVLSALGVGIGFGLQGMVNNFVSGLILLFEQPIREGDIIEAGGTLATIKRIGLRSTTAQTYDKADIIIPNADLISNQVTNWTLGNRQVRFIVPVGVAYGSDVPRVMQTLLECTGAIAKVTKKPEPQVHFLEFGESSLNFEVRVWVRDAEDRLAVKSELHQEIDRRFREAGIVIAFPQRDVHLNGSEPFEIRVVSDEAIKDKT